MNAEAKNNSNSTTKARKKVPRRAYDENAVVENLAETFLIPKDSAGLFMRRFATQVRASLLEGMSVNMPGIGSLNVVKYDSTDERYAPATNSRVLFWPRQGFIDELSLKRHASAVGTGMVNLSHEMSQERPPFSKVLNRNIAYRELIEALCHLWHLLLIHGVTVRIRRVGSLHYGLSIPWRSRNIGNSRRPRNVYMETDPAMMERVPMRWKADGTVPERKRMGLLLSRARELAPSLVPPDEPAAPPKRSTLRGSVSKPGSRSHERKLQSPDRRVAKES